jgi:hypothetical protein
MLEGRAKATEVAGFIFKSLKSRTISGWLLPESKDANHLQTFRQ